MKNYIDTYKETRRKLKAYEYVEWMMSWDQETEAPEASHDYRSKQYEVIAEEAYALESNPTYVEAIEKLYENLNQLDDPDFKVEIKKEYKVLIMVKKVPKY